MTGEELRAFRLAHRLTYAGFGALVEPPVDRSSVCQMESGKREIGKVMAHRLRLAMAKARERAESA